MPNLHKLAEWLLLFLVALPFLTGAALFLLMLAVLVGIPIPF
jgi:hypothetical protein